ncbi:MAG: hypothetical protein DME19_11890 [Verrucomicrobia bacterium]|nr:MAG: hypothetical protein DME19_11890 [Verrucomicrobiota bacterium]
MIFLPIVDRELRVAARRPITYWTRLAFAMAGAGVVSLALLYASVAGTGAAGIGGGLFYFLSLLALGFSALAGVFLTADCLSEERREGTLGLLFLTDLKGYDVVFGKLLERSLSACHGLIAIFPVRGRVLAHGAGLSQHDLLFSGGRDARFFAQPTEPSGDDGDRGIDRGCGQHSPVC